ncbi:uncharacterized protein JCM15063_003932 [Sporobolomyces koalae]|uniref:uncharacterized protein n=1 Tax=Sporobolomyces koalae TaxID=500713 RepID=UPI00316DA99A
MLCSLRSVLRSLAIVAIAWGYAASANTAAANEVHVSHGTDAAGNPQTTLGIDPTEGFTMVIATFQRDLLLPPLLKHLTSTPPPSLRQILIVWQNVDTPLPEFLSPRALDELSTSGVAVSIRKSWKNSMNERFRPVLDWGEHIQTKAVMIMDDDIVLRKESLEWGYQEFVEANKYGPGRIVGFSSREFEPAGQEGEWNYITKPTSTYSMILSNAAFLKKEWLVKYWDDSQEMSSLRNYVDSVFNCDDILINYLVSNMTGTSPLLLQPSTPLRTVPTEGGLWNRALTESKGPETITTSAPRPEHFSTRKECLAHFFSHFAQHAPAQSSPEFPLLHSRTSISQDVQDNSRWLFENEMWETPVWNLPGVDNVAEDSLSEEEEEMLENGDYDNFLSGLTDEEVDELMQSLEEMVDEETSEEVHLETPKSSTHAHEEL